MKVRSEKLEVRSQRSHVNFGRLLLFTFSLFLFTSYFSLALAQDEDELTPDQAVGKEVYDTWCINCHGEGGAGDGPAADFFTPRPRDFRYGIYKIRSTESGQLPTDEDLIRVVSKGMPGTGMPSWEESLSQKEIQKVVEYIKSFSRKFARAKEPPSVIKMGTPTKPTEESITRGKELFREIECFKCHGDEGRGDGPSAPELEDDWEYPIRPRNFTRGWEFRGGHRPEDIYRRIIGGVAGTPMPSFMDSLDEKKTWDLVNYVRSLSPDERPPLIFVLKAKKLEGQPLPGDPEDPVWAEADLAEYPLVGQVIQDPRLFTPSVVGVQIQAFYNDEAIALRLSWDDPSETKPDPGTDIYEDAMSVQFPVEIPKGSKRPYFLMGDAELPVNLWRWSSGGGDVVEQNAWGTGRVETQGQSSQQIDGIINYRNGRYRLVLRRPLTTADSKLDLQFKPGDLIPMAFFVWDGSNQETGKQMALSHWYYLLLEPPTPAKVYIYPPLAVVLAAGVQWWVIRRLRKSS